MRNILTVVIYLTSILTISAQTWIGINYRLGHSNVMNHTKFKERYMKSTAQSILLYSVFSINKNTHVKCGIEIEGREFSVSGNYYEILGDYPNYFLGTEIITRNRYNEMGYVSLPITILYNLKIQKKTYLQIGFGGYFSYLTNQIWSYRYDGGRFQYDNIGPLSPIDNPYNDKYKKVDGGFILELGLRYKINDLLTSTVSGIYKKGIINIIDSKEINAYNMSNLIGISLEYEIN
jgi:hypothetical protein